MGNSNSNSKYNSSNAIGKKGGLAHKRSCSNPSISTLNNPKYNNNASNKHKSLKKSGSAYFIDGL
jgi:hypothetical protein